MKIYIVTSGEYSDYDIERVFLDENKANKYAKMRAYSKVEEYETEENEFSEIIYASISYQIENDKEDYNFTMHITNTLDDDEKDMHYTGFYGWTTRPVEYLNLKRVIRNRNYDEEKLRDKYLKVCHDLYAKVKYMQTQGHTMDDINVWLKDSDMQKGD